MIVREEEELEFWVRTTPCNGIVLLQATGFAVHHHRQTTGHHRRKFRHPRPVRLGNRFPRGFRYPRYSSIMPWEPNNAGDKNIVGTHPFESIPLPSPSAYRIKPSFWEVQDLGADRPSSASERRSSSSGFFAGNQRDPQQWGSDLALPDESRDRILYRNHRDPGEKRNRNGGNGSSKV